MDTFAMLDIESQLPSLFDRLSATPMEPSAEDVATVIKCYHQASYLLTYVEGNSKYVDGAILLRFREDFFADGPLCKRLAQIFTRRALGAGMQVDSDLADWFRLIIFDADGNEERRDAANTVERILHDIDVERARLLEQLGFVATPKGGDSALARALEQIGATSARDKLLLVWSRIADAQGNKLAEAIDRLVDLRWKHARQQGFRSVAEQSFTACGVSIATVWRFIEDYIRQGLEERQSFLKTIYPNAPSDDAIRAQLLRSGHDQPTVSAEHAVVVFDRLVKLAFTVIERVFGINFSSRFDASAHMQRYDAWRTGERLGTLTLDLIPPGPPSPMDRANAINVADPLQAGYLPEARVLCLLADAMDCPRTLSLEAAHLFLHGMGHALVHLAVRPLRPSSSGLDTLPLERLEGLSHWFERLIDHNLFEEHLATTDDQRRALHVYRQVQRIRLINTRMEQAIVAAIDLQVHAYGGTSIRGAFDDVVESLGDDVGVSFERVARFSTAPLFRDYPGAGFVYPWGSTFGAAHIAAFSGDGQATRSLRSYFDRDEISVVPDPRTEFRVDVAGETGTL